MLEWFSIIATHSLPSPALELLASGIGHLLVGVAHLGRVGAILLLHGVKAFMP